MKRYTPSTATPVGTNTMFLQIGTYTLNTIFSASAILSHITKNLGSSSGKTFFAKSKMSIVPPLEQYLLTDTNFDPPWFSLDNTFKYK
jgi:hypothetical protein